MLRDRELLEIKLAELQIEMQMITGKHQTYMTITYSLMIAFVVFLFTSGLMLLELDFVYMGIIISIVCIVFAGIIDFWYSNKVKDIARRIQELRKQYEW